MTIISYVGVLCNSIYEKAGGKEIFLHGLFCRSRHITLHKNTSLGIEVNASVGARRAVPEITMYFEFCHRVSKDHKLKRINPTSSDVCYHIPASGLNVC